MGDDCCGKTIDVAALETSQRRVLTVVLGINAVTFVMMVAAASHSGSSALLSGALDNLGDALTYAFSLAVVGAGVAAKARVALLKGALICAAGIGVAAQIIWRLVTGVDTPIFESMGLAAVLNLGANLVCLWLLTPHRDADTNMASVWECSRNDVAEGVAVIAAAAAVWMSASGWPDLLIAAGLLVMFMRSASRVLGSAWRDLDDPASTAPT